MTAKVDVDAKPMLEGIAALLKRPTVRIEITTSVGYTAHAPCLLAQLLDAIGVSNERGGGRAAGSRLLISADALDLLLAITYDTNAWAVALGVDRRRYLSHVDGRAGQTPPLGRLLRAAGAAAITQRLPEMVDRIAGNTHTWARHIEQLLAVTVPRRAIRGAQCVHCGARWIVETRDSEAYREPALEVAYVPVADRLQPYLWCRGCGADEWLDDPLEVLSA